MALIESLSTQDIINKGPCLKLRLRLMVSTQNPAILKTLSGNSFGVKEGGASNST